MQPRKPLAASKISLKRCASSVALAWCTGSTQICSVFGPTCDALDTVSLAENLPEDLEIGELLYSEKVGAYTHASSTYFNGFPPANVVHINR